MVHMHENIAKQNTKNLGNQNALVHGVYAKDILLPWDSRDDFMQLHEELKREWAPNGPSEEEAVLDLAVLYWRKRTVWRLCKSKVLADPYTQDIVELKAISWTAIRKGLRDAAKDQRSLLAIATRHVKKVGADLRIFQNQLSESSTEEEVKTFEAKVNACVAGIANGQALVEVLRAVPDAEQSFDKAHAPESLEKVTRLEAAIDARIAKVLNRLVALKEFKRTPAGGSAGYLDAPKPTSAGVATGGDVPIPDWPED
jgi:hypothetical protein